MVAHPRPRRPIDQPPTPTEPESIRRESCKVPSGRVDERCPTRYYPVRPPIERRRTPIRYC